MLNDYCDLYLPLRSPTFWFKRIFFLKSCQSYRIQDNCICIFLFNAVNNKANKSHNVSHTAFKNTSV